MKEEDLKERLLSILKEKALMRGDFLLSSGQRSSFYIDAKRVTLDGEGLQLISDLVFGIMQKIGAKVIGGPCIGADPVVGAVLCKDRSLRGFLIRRERKEHGTKALIEGNLHKGDKVLLFEDVLTTGQTLLSAIKAVEKEGAEVVAVVVLVDREEEGGELLLQRGYKLFPLFKKSQILP
jgi:orotate phosphoribosyltransferase